MKKVITCILALTVLLQCSAFAKSNDLIDYNLDAMRNLLYEEDFRVFVQSSAEDYVYYGAKFEPRSGVIIGTPDRCDYDGIENGVKAYYDWFVPSEKIDNSAVKRESVAEVKSEHKKLTAWNWNFASKKAVDMNSYENYVKNYIDKLAARGEDILLVFGKEMNIDDNFLDEQVFIDCFRYVADYAHTKENIAMVWAPNDTGGLDTRLIDFYPGDEYVDWIGCSLYSMPYFTGDPNAGEGSNIGFIMGPYANPVMRAKIIHNFITDNNIKKPVFITEGGIGYQSPDGEDFTDWALQQLRKYYGELVRVYPEFKCIVSFNNYIADGDYYRYDMGSNPKLLANLKTLTSDPVYITDYTKTSDVSYIPMYDGIKVSGSLKLSAYGYQPKVEWMKVKYFLDGNEVNSTDYPPYTYEIANVSEGRHKLTAEFLVNGSVVKSLEYGFIMQQSAERVYKDEKDNGLCKFSDMDNTSAEVKNAVGTLASKGIINGVGNNKFNPSAFVTRAEVSTMLTGALGLKEGSGMFKDVKKVSWYYPYVAAAKDAGLLDGFEDGTFRPDEYLTNEQLIAILSKYLLNNGTEMTDKELEFKDATTYWAVDYVRLAADKGIVLPYSDNTFRGSERVTRADCAVMINRFMNTLV